MRRLALCMCVAWLCAEGAYAQSRARRTREGWTRQAQIGAHVTEGNRDSAQTRAQVGAKGRGENWESEFKVRGEIGELNRTRNRERVAAEFLHRADLSPRAYLAYRFEFLYDGIADLDYRLVASPSIGWFIVREERQELRLEVGPAGVLERKGGDREAYPALRLAQYYEARVTAVSRLLQGVEYLPEIRAESGAYLAKAFVELRADLDKQIALHLRLEGDYDNRPAEGKQKQDTTFSASISYTF
jgi:putative salt-induced outer membrane protein YdiY